MSESAPTVSICIPTFEGAAWLSECLASARAQTFDDVEILVVDDGSADATVAIAEAAAAEDPRVRVVVDGQRRGLAGNWNHAIAQARGEWIKLLFQDDVLEPECVARMVEVGRRHGAALVVCDRRVEFAGVAAEVEAYFRGLPSLDELFGTEEDIPAAAVARVIARRPGVNVFGEPSSVLLHRSVPGRFGGFKDSLIQLCDLEYWSRVATGAGFARARSELSTFRVHGGSASARNAAGRAFRKDVLDTLVLLHDYAFDPRFAGLRAVAPPVSFSLLAFNELQRARRDARADAELARALAEVVRAHPRLGSPLWRIWHRVRKQLPSKA